MDTFVNSSWYYLRFASLGQDESILDENADYWCPVDYYIGGVEHAVMHLLYARFFHKIIRDLGFVKTDEPFDKLLTLGMVHKDGAKMSKQKGNVVSPKKLIDKYGADTIRLYTIFAAPPEQSLEWSDSGIAGCYKFLNKLFNFANSIPNDIFTKVNQNDVGNIIYDKNLIEKRKQIFKIFKKIDFDYKRSQFNTVVSSCMSLLNLLDVNTQESQIVSCEALKIILLSLEPITPHICQNLWTKYKENSFISDALWPKIPVGILDGDNSKFVIQINGKLKDSINIEKDLNETQIIELVKNLDSVLACNEKIIKIIIVKNRNLINVVMKK
jgi:leucyl-tRNA synthetase